jgi:hypothetical protein
MPQAWFHQVIPKGRSTYFLRYWFLVCPRPGSTRYSQKEGVLTWDIGSWYAPGLVPPGTLPSDCPKWPGWCELACTDNILMLRKLWKKKCFSSIVYCTIATIHAIKATIMIFSFKFWTVYRILRLQYHKCAHRSAAGVRNAERHTCLKLGP